MTLNGRTVPFAEASIHPLSTGFKYGAAVFEGLRGYWNDDLRQLFVFRLDDHIERLFQSMRLSRMQPEFDPASARAWIIDTVRANQIREDVHIRVQAFVDEVDGRLEGMAPVSVWVATMPMGKYFGKLGVEVATSSWARIGEASAPPRIKALGNYHNSRLSGIEAKLNGYDAAVMLDGSGHVTEGSGYNVFLVRGKQLVTPDVTSGILEGITRDSVIRIATEVAGLDVVERRVDRTELYVADEIFFCGTAAEITPVLSIDRLALNGGEPGATTLALRELYRAAATGTDPRLEAWATPAYEAAASPRS